MEQPPSGADTGFNVGWGGRFLLPPFLFMSESGPESGVLFDDTPEVRIY